MKGDSVNTEPREKSHKSKTLLRAYGKPYIELYGIRPQ